MLYHAYQAQADLMAPWRGFARSALEWMRMPPGWMVDSRSARSLAATLELTARARLTHARPDFRIRRVVSEGRERAVREQAVLKTPFGTLLRFAKDGIGQQPRVLVVAPLSGHFATLLRNTVEVLLPEHDVYVTDWHNARDVPVEAGRFGFDEYVEHVINFLRTMGEGSHLLAVCQPCAHALAAIAVMAQTDDPAQPRSMTLMAGPIDTRVNPTVVNRLARENPIEWFEKKLVSPVPFGFRGAGRQVYPGFVQLMAFMNMNRDRHLKAHRDLYDHIAKGEFERADAIRRFYDEYFAVLDLTAEFYLETVNLVFQEDALPKGELSFRDMRIDPSAIRRTALLTVEGERDDICAVGQTVAAHDLCTGLKPFRKSHYLQPGVGHYGVFSGSKWAGQIYPQVRALILAND